MVRERVPHAHQLLRDAARLRQREYDGLGARVWPSQVALLAAKADIEGAFDRTCELLATVERLRAGSEDQELRRTYTNRYRVRLGLLLAEDLSAALRLGRLEALLAEAVDGWGPEPVSAGRADVPPESALLAPVMCWL